MVAGPGAGRCGETGGGAACEPFGCTEGRWLRVVGAVGGVGSGMSVWRGRTYDPRAVRPETGSAMGVRGRTGPFPLPPGGVPFEFTDVPPHRRKSPTWRNPPSDVQRPNAGNLGPLPPKSARSRPRPPGPKLLPNMATLGPGTRAAFSARGCEIPAKHWCLRNRTNSRALPGYCAFWPHAELGRWEYPQMGCPG